MRLETPLAHDDRQHLFDAELTAARIGGPLRTNTGLGPEPERILAAVALAAPDPAEALVARARRAFAVAETLRGQVNHDRSLHYEVAVDILTALMSYCTTAAWHQEHAAEPEPDAAAVARYRELRQAYWSVLVDLDPADPAAVAAVVHTDGVQLARLCAAETEAPQPISDTYRLRPADHAAIFEHHIVPEILAGFGAGEQSLAVVVTGPPGSGKTTLCRRLHDSWPGEHGCAVVDPGVVATFHPHEWHRGLGDNQLLDDAVATDVEHWIVMAVRRILANRNDVVLEIADESSGVADEFASVFRTAGYRAELRRVEIPASIAARHAAIRGRWRRGHASLGGPVTEGTGVPVA